MVQMEVVRPGGEPEAALFEVWQAVCQHSEGQRQATISASARQLRPIRGSTWVKKQWAVFDAFRAHGVREIAPSHGYTPCQADRDRGIYAPSEVLRWLGAYASKDLNESELRRLLTWHRRWDHDRGHPATLAPTPSDPHEQGLLRARRRLADRLVVPEPMRVAENFFSGLAQPPPDLGVAEEVSADPALEQLELHVSDEELWKILEAHSAALAAYVSDVHEFVGALEAEALARTAAQRGYGPSSLGFGPDAGNLLSSLFTLVLLDHAFALLAGEAPAGWRSQITPWTAKEQATFKLLGGWRPQSLEVVAIGDQEAMQKTQMVQREMDYRLLRSEELRRLWTLYERLVADNVRLVASVNALDAKRIADGHCWGCPMPVAAISG